MRSVYPLRPAVAALFALLLPALVAAAPQSLVSGTALDLALTPAAPKAEFTVVNDGSRLFALRVVGAAPGAAIRFKARAAARFGAYALSSELQWDFKFERAPSQLFDGLPQFPTTWTCEAALLGKEPRACTVQLEDQGAAPDIRWGEATGSLLVRNTGQTRLTAVVERGVNLRHPLFKGSAVGPDTTPAGDALFRLPAGYWQLTAGGGEGVHELRSTLIPVTSGGETVVDWPQMRTLEGEKTKGLTELVLRDATADGETGRLLVAAPMFSEAPKPEAIRIVEGGQPGEVLTVESIPAKLHVVVLFDSSFSMRKIFPQAQDAAYRFVETLPPECTVDFINFESRVRDLPSADRASLLAAIRGLKSEGSTRLYDAIIRGLTKCAGHRRSAIVVFTDGFDAQVDDPGNGSRATPEQVFDAVAATPVPLFTIGYGEKPDVDTLKRLADASGGATFRAQPETIADVFTQIGRLVDRDYRITYRRPAKVSASNTPVLTLVLDVSGSMDMEPKNPRVDYRIEKAKDLLRGFFGRLPAGSVVQLFTFSDNVDLVQVPTADPTRLLRSLAPIVAGGGTETLLATKAALASLERIPSRNRYLLFITDAALSVPDPGDHKKFETALAALKAQNIRSLWVGMVDTKDQAPFADAAALSGGTFVVSPGTGSMAEALASLEKSLKEPGAGGNEIAVEVLIDKPDSAGAHHLHGGTGLFKLPVSGFTAEHSVGCLTATIKNSDPAPQLTLNLPSVNGSAAPAAVRGSPATGSGDSVELNRIPIDRTGKNAAVEFTVHEARIYSRLHGFDLPATHRFVELAVTLKNILPVQLVVIPDKGAAHPAAWVTTGQLKGRTVNAAPPYLIPDLRHHLFLRWNDSAEFPPSALSTLDAEPFFLPDDPSVLTNPGTPLTGRLVFLVQGTNLQQASLHFYDVNYGHFDLALVGPVAPRPAALTSLPQKATAQLSDTFAISLLGSVDSPDTVATVAPGKGNLFRTVQLGFESRVQALLTVQPAASFDLLIGTDKGPLATPLAPVTDAVPGGLYRPASLAPGSHNQFQQLYCLPAALATAPSAIFVETKTKDVVLPLAAPMPVYLSAQPADPADGIAIAVNSLALAGKDSGLDRPMLAADVTITDVEDKFSTGLGNLFVLAPVAAPSAPFIDPDAPIKSGTLGSKDNAVTHKGLGNLSADDSKKAKPQRVDPATGSLLFGLPVGAVVPDGATRRGVLLFTPPTEGEWVLAFHGRELARVSLPAKPLPAADAWLVARRPKYPQLDEGNPATRVEKFVADRARAGAFKQLARDAKSAPPRADETGRILPATLEPPMLTVAGAQAWKELLAADETQLWKTLGELRLQSSSDKPWASQLAPETILTQRSGSPADFAELARQWYAAHGVTTAPMQAALSDAGKQRLRARLPLGDLPGQIPLITTPQGTWAVPFALRGDEVPPLLTAQPAAAKAEPTSTTITISVACKPIATTAASKMGDMSSALGGGDASGEQRFTLYTGSLPTAALSRDALDVFFYETGGRDPEIRVQLEGPEGTVDGKSGIKTHDWKPVREVIEIRAPGQKVRALERELGDAPLADTCHTLAIAAPDLPTPAATALAAAWAAQKTAEVPNHRSLVRWLGRSKIAKFLTAQTRWEQANAPALGVALSRAAAPRVLIATVCAGPDGKLRQSLDLRQSDPVVSGETTACASFRLMSGLTSTSFEGGAVGGKSVLDFWNSPGDFIVVSPKNRGRFAQDLKAKGVPAAVVDRVKSGPEFLLFGKNPVTFGGQPLYGWLAIDPTSYAVTSTLSTGENGAVEHALVELLEKTLDQSLRYFVGVDYSVWSVATFTFEGLPYEETLNKAEEFARKSGSKLEWVANPKEFAEIAAKKFSLFLGDRLGFKEAAEEMEKFADGFQVGVTEYFKHARAGLPKKEEH